MARIAVITGDLINSTRVANPDAFRNQLRELVQLINRRYQAKSNLYRGDGFQVALDGEHFNAIEVALVLRTGLIAQSPDSENRWDARIAIAFDDDDLSATEENGPAYIQSGRSLDAMKKASLLVVGDDEVSSLALNVATAFADDVVSHLTAVEAEVLYYYFLYRESHQKIAERLGKKRPTVTVALQRARYRLLEQYTRDMQKFIEMYHEP